MLLPFCSVLDWHGFSVRIRTAQIPQLPQLLRQIPQQRVRAMQRRLAEVKARYFLFPFNTALSMIRLRVRTMLEDEAKAKAKATHRRRS